MEALNKGDHRTVSNLMLHNIMGPTQTVFIAELQLYTHSCKLINALSDIHQRK